MRLNKRDEYREMEARLDIAERILESIEGIPGGWLKYAYDCSAEELENMSWSDKLDHHVKNDEGMAVFDIPEPSDDDWENERTHKGMLALEANKLIYDTLMAWIDGKKRK